MWFESVQMSSFTLFPTKWCENKDLTWNKAKFILKISFWSNLSTREKMFFAVRCCSLSLLIPRPGNLGGEMWGVSGQHPNPKCRVEGRWMAEGLDGIYRTSLIVPSKVDHHWSLRCSHHTKILSVPCLLKFDFGTGWGEDGEQLAKWNI